MMKSKIYFAGAALCACLVLLSGFMVYRHYANDRQYTQEFDELAEALEQAQATDDDTTPAPADVPLTEEETVLPDYAQLYLQNSELVGWLSIEGTTINYPVMQTSDRPDYYLRRNFEKQQSDHGTPYAAEDCDIFSPSDNIVIYGHHIKNGKMFGALMDYTQKSFYEQHKVIRFDTLLEYGEYEIVAVFKTVAYTEAGFPYYRFIEAQNEDDFDAYIAE